MPMSDIEPAGGYAIDIFNLSFVCIKVIGTPKKNEQVTSKNSRHEKLAPLPITSKALVLSVRFADHTCGQLACHFRHTIDQNFCRLKQLHYKCGNENKTKATAKKRSTC